MSQPLVKFVVFIPASHLEALQCAIGDAGFGKIGNYTHCSFVSLGSGFFKPNAKAHPHIGNTEELTTVEEARLEFICYKHEVSLVIQCITTHHPYEEPAYDIFPLLNHHDI